MSYEFRFKEPTDCERRNYILDMLKQLSDMATQCGEDVISSRLDKILHEHGSSGHRCDETVSARSFRGKA